MNHRGPLQKSRQITSSELQRSDDLILADSRVKNFTHEGLEKTDTLAGCTFPHLGGFDEFSEINVYRKRIR